jgi:hypothetical protein
VIARYGFVEQCSTRAGGFRACQLSFDMMDTCSSSVA